MRGLELARRYWNTYGADLLATQPALAGRVAAGLVGHGSECFGFDDERSRDHDFGPGFCLWLGEADFAAHGAALQAAYAALPPEFAGFPARSETPRAGQRVGVFSIGGFFTPFLGAPALPISDADWLQIPETLLACAVNGEVFADPAGEFSRWRAQLAAYYPEGARRRKLAQAVAAMAQNGQYNLGRALARQDAAAALLAQAEFLRATCTALHVLARRFTPPPKWLARSVQTLPGLGHLHGRVEQIARSPAAACQHLAEALCGEVLGELVAQGFTRPGEPFLEAHVDAILGR